MKSRPKVDILNIPEWKRVPGTCYVVDCFNLRINGATNYFLSHFHADHYNGLNKSSSIGKVIFGSLTTCNLAHMKLRVPKSNLIPLDFYKWYQIEKGIFVFLIDANHCPGASCFVFSVKNRLYLHTGDFRCSEEWYSQYGYLHKIFSQMVYSPIPMNKLDFSMKSNSNSGHHFNPVRDMCDLTDRSNLLISDMSSPFTGKTTEGINDDISDDLLAKFETSACPPNPSLVCENKKHIPDFLSRKNSQSDNFIKYELLSKQKTHILVPKVVNFLNYVRRRLIDDYFLVNYKKVCPGEIFIFNDILCEMIISLQSERPKNMECNENRLFDSRKNNFSPMKDINPIPNKILPDSVHAHFFRNNKINHAENRNPHGSKRNTIDKHYKKNADKKKYGNMTSIKYSDKMNIKDHPMLSVDICQNNKYEYIKFEKVKQPRMHLAKSLIQVNKLQKTHPTKKPRSNPRNKSRLNFKSEPLKNKKGSILEFCSLKSKHTIDEAQNIIVSQPAFPPKQYSSREYPFFLSTEIFYDILFYREISSIIFFHDQSSKKNFLNIFNLNYKLTLVCVSRLRDLNTKRHRSANHPCCMFNQNYDTHLSGLVYCTPDADEQVIREISYIVTKFFLLYLLIACHSHIALFRYMHKYLIAEIHRCFRYQNILQQDHFYLFVLNTIYSFFIIKYTHENSYEHFSGSINHSTNGIGEQFMFHCILKNFKNLFGKIRDVRSNTWESEITDPLRSSPLAKFHENTLSKLLLNPESLFLYFQTEFTYPIFPAILDFCAYDKYCLEIRFPSSKDIFKACDLFIGAFLHTNLCKIQKYYPHNLLRRSLNEFMKTYTTGNDNKNMNKMHQSSDFCDNHNYISSSYYPKRPKINKKCLEEQKPDLQIQFSKDCISKHIKTLNQNIKISSQNRHLCCIKFDTIFLDNTYFGFKHFDSQKIYITDIINSLNDFIYDRSLLCPRNPILLFSTYCIGKERIFFSIAKHFNYRIYVEDRKRAVFDCFDEYTQQKLESDVDHIIDKVEKLNLAKRFRIFKSAKDEVFSKKQALFDMFCSDKKLCNIFLISQMQLNPKDINRVIADLNTQKVFVFVGSGWNEKKKSFSLRRNGKIIRNGIEFIYFPYSEHSSSTELNIFKNIMHYDKIINTVTHKNMNHYKSIQMT